MIRTTERGVDRGIGLALEMRRSNASCARDTRHRQQIPRDAGHLAVEILTSGAAALRHGSAVIPVNEAAHLGQIGFSHSP